MRRDMASVALLIDYDNLEIGASYDMPGRPLDLGSVVELAQRYGTVVVARAYADWNDPNERLAVYESGIEPCFAPIFRTTADQPGKSLADTVLVADGVDVLWRVMPDVLVLVTSDKDILPLARLARLRGCRTVVVGSDRTAVPLRRLADEYVTYRDIVRGTGVPVATHQRAGLVPVTRSAPGPAPRLLPEARPPAEPRPRAEPRRTAGSRVAALPAEARPPVEPVAPPPAPPPARRVPEPPPVADDEAASATALGEAGGAPRRRRRRRGRGAGGADLPPGAPAGLSVPAVELEGDDRQEPTSEQPVEAAAGTDGILAEAAGAAATVLAEGADGAADEQAMAVEEAIERVVETRPPSPPARLSFAPFGPPDDPLRGSRDEAAEPVAPAAEDRAAIDDAPEEPPAAVAEAVPETVGPDGTPVFGTVDVAEAGAPETIGADETPAPAKPAPRPRRPRQPGTGRRARDAAQADAAAITQGTEP